MVMYYGCLEKNLDPKISRVLASLILITILSLPILIYMVTLPSSTQYLSKENIYALLTVSTLFLAIVQVAAIFCKKTDKENI
jgi:hypothetical protein